MPLPCSQVGVSGSDIQALTGQLNLLDVETLAEARRSLGVLGYRFEKGWPRMDLDPTMSSLLISHARLHAAGAKLSAHLHGNVSKDSLYAESNEESFIALRRDQDVGSSEMEMSVLCRLAAEQTHVRGDPVVVGMVVTVLGVIPGSSFLTDKVGGVRVEDDEVLGMGLEISNFLICLTGSGAGFDRCGPSCCIGHTIRPIDQASPRGCLRSSEGGDRKAATGCTLACPSPRV